jgi:U4/U6.U5 tri-snRNP-associated protein 1
MGLDKKILSYYDDPTADDDTGFILGAKGQVNYEHERKMQEEKKVLGVVPLGGIALDYEKTKEMADFYTKEEELAFKKPKKKKKVSRKRKDIDEDKMNEINQEEDTEMMDVIKFGSLSSLGWPCYSQIIF